MTDILADLRDRLNLAERENERLRDQIAAIGREAGVANCSPAAVQNAVKAMRERAERAELQNRYGTPFDPTGAKTGTEIAALRGRLEKAEADTARLDWLEALAALGIYVDVHGGCKTDSANDWCVLGFDDSDRVDSAGIPLAEPCAEHMPSLRAAIDRAKESKSHD